MKKLLAIALGLVCAGVLSAQAAAAKPTLTPEQKALKKEMMQNYDKNGDKKLDKDEIAAMKPEDKKKYEEAGIMPKAKKAKTP